MKAIHDAVVETYSQLASVYDDPSNIASCWGRVTRHSLGLLRLRAGSTGAPVREHRPGCDLRGYGRPGRDQLRRLADAGQQRHLIGGQLR